MSLKAAILIVIAITALVCLIVAGLSPSTRRTTAADLAALQSYLEPELSN